MSYVGVGSATEWGPHREIRRRTHGVGAFPDGERALNLAVARWRHIAGTHWSTRRYLDLQPLHDARIIIA